jgi:hypothetical protein
MNYWDTWLSYALGLYGGVATAHLHPIFFSDGREGAWREENGLRACLVHIQNLPYQNYGKPKLGHANFGYQNLGKKFGITLGCQFFWFKIK